MSPLAAYLLLFVAFGIGFIFIHLMAGKLIRPNKPFADKRTIYECGEPTIGSSWIQFDLRFYVVALLFVIFDVEVAFFFPWAVVFGKANTLANFGPLDSAAAYKESGELAWELVPPSTRSIHATQHELLMQTKDEDVTRLKELRQQPEAKLSTEEKAERSRLEAAEARADKSRQQASSMSWLALLEIAVFFGVLLVGYAYLWRRGDLAWVRSLSAESTAREPLTSSPPTVSIPNGSVVHT